MRNFLDQTGGLWMKGALIGKVGSVFSTSTAQHGGQETTITCFHTTLLHHGMVVVGVPYSEQRLVDKSEISGGSPYGATTIAGADGSRQPSENELADRPLPGRTRRHDHQAPGRQTEFELNAAMRADSARLQSIRNRNERRTALR